MSVKKKAEITNKLKFLLYFHLNIILVYLLCVKLLHHRLALSL